VILVDIGARTSREQATPARGGPGFTG
jgi:hypothetical protein